MDWCFESNTKNTAIITSSAANNWSKLISIAKQNVRNTATLLGELIAARRPGMNWVGLLA
jgi:hypothetical protein